MRLGPSINIAKAGLIALAGLALTFAQTTSAQTLIPIEAFSETPVLQAPRLSPDGEFVALPVSG